MPAKANTIAPTTAWKYSDKPGRRLGLHEKLLADYYLPYLRGRDKRTKNGKEDAELIEFMLIQTRVWAAILDLPIWKLITMIQARGMAGFIQDHGEQMDLLLQRDKKNLDIAQHILDLSTDHKDELDTSLQQHYNKRVAESALKYTV